MSTTTTLSVNVRIGTQVQIVTVAVNARFIDLLTQLNLPRDSIIINQSTGELVENNRSFIVDFSPNLSFLIAPADGESDERRRVTVFFENQSERVWIFPRWRVRDLIEAAVLELNLPLDEEYVLTDEIGSPPLNPDECLSRSSSDRDRDYFLARVGNNNTLCGVCFMGLLVIALVVLVILAIVL